MGIFGNLFSLDDNEDERMEAFEEWNIYLSKAMSCYRQDVEGKRVVIRNQPLPGPREIALIIEVGLELLGATVVTSMDEPRDYELQISRYDGEKAYYVLFDASGNMIEENVVHHEIAVSSAITTLAKHCRT